MIYKKLDIVFLVIENCRYEGMSRMGYSYSFGDSIVEKRLPESLQKIVGFFAIWGRYLGFCIL